MWVDNRLLVAVAALAVAGVAVAATGGPVASQAQQVNVTTDLQFDDQNSNGSAVTVARANLSDGGFVAIYNETGTFLGATDYLENRSHADVPVSLDRELDSTSTLVAIAHRETDQNRLFTFLLTNGEQDTPYLRNGIVMDTAEVTVEAEDNVTETPTPGEETPGEETPAEETPGEETPGEETPAEETPGEETPGEETPAEETPGEETPGEETPGEETPAEETPGEETPGEETPGEETPAEETPGEETPGDEAPGEATPTPGA